MLSNVYTFYFVVLITQALCAYASAGANPLYIVPTTTTDPSSVDVEDDSWRTVLRRNMNEVLAARQAAPDNTTNNLQLDMVAWDAQTTRLCTDKLRTISKASNPAGIAVCYNVPVFNRDNWFFVAELRLYKVSEPDSDWAAIGNDIGVGLDYRAAEVQRTNLGERNTTLPDGGPMLVSTFHFLGMVQEDFRRDGASDADFRQMLVPRIIIRADKADGTKLETNVSTDEASFVSGQFAIELAGNNQPTPSTIPPPEPFQLPGTRIEIMPIGLIFYSTYMVLGVSIVLFGTFERWKFRDQYRRRVAQGIPGGPRI